MKKPTVKYSKGEVGRVRIVEDFLPSPDRLVLREDNVKVTLSLSQRSVAFFKRAARQRRVPYQRMIRALVDAYAEKQEGKGRSYGLALLAGTTRSPATSLGFVPKLKCSKFCLDQVSAIRPFW